MSGTLTLTLPLLLIGAALILGALLSVHWHRQDDRFYEAHKSDWDLEMDRRREMRDRAEARHRKAA